MIIVADRYPLWLPELNTGISPTIKPGDWQLSSWSGEVKKLALKLDLEQWNKVGRPYYPWPGHPRLGQYELPPLGLMKDYALEVLSEYPPELLEEKPWIEVLAFVEEKSDS